MVCLLHNRGLGSRAERQQEAGDCWTSRQMDRCTGRQRDRQVNKQVHRVVGRKAEKQTDKDKDRQAGKQAGRKTEKQTESWTDRQVGRQTGTSRGISSAHRCTASGSEAAVDGGKRYRCRQTSQSGSMRGAHSIGQSLIGQQAHSSTVCVGGGKRGNKHH